MSTTENVAVTEK